ncbi:MAG: hypothetical protein ACRD50_07095 [Candidatus Acidiferrales bacterium]
MAQEFQIRLDAKLDRMLCLLGALAVRGLSQTEKIETLSRFGFAPKEIAKTLGTTPNTVRVALVGIRRAEKQGRRRPAANREEQDHE